MSDNLTPEEREFIEVAEWCERQHREVGVTPSLREAYEYYQRHYGHKDRGPIIIVGSSPS